MAVQNPESFTDNAGPIPFIDLSFDSSDQESVLPLIYQIRPAWQKNRQQLKILKFTDGITNTLLKVSRHVPGSSNAEADEDAVLMRAYGNGTDLIIDRNREALSHSLLAARQLAPPLLARFKNGLLYGFIPGVPCKAQDLAKEPIWRGVAQKLGEWHATIPISGISRVTCHSGGNGHINGNSQKRPSIATRQPIPNIWSIMQTWVDDALSTQTDKERARKEMLQQEIERSFHELDTQDDVFCHCDLLCANIIQLPSPQATVQPVTFIDYEYATPAPAAFDIANHFAEWAGYDCDYSKVPGPSVRRRFLQEYVASYSKFADQDLDESAGGKLFDQVERYRGLPGLYWGIWALIQARISAIDFNYSEYAEQRLGEYFAWRGEVDGTRQRQGAAMPLRERTWAGN